MKKRTIIAAVAAAAVIAYFSWGWLGGGFGPPAMGGMPVSVAQVIRKPVTEWSEFSGRLKAVDDVAVRPRVSGTIDDIHFMGGDYVKKGDPLFTLDLRPYHAAHDQASAALDAARARADLATMEQKRAAKLLVDKAISQREYDERHNAAKEALAAVKSAEAELVIAELNLEYAEVRAPVEGRVGRIEVTVGNTVDAGPNAPVMTTIQSLRPIYADFEIDEQSYLRAAKSLKGNAKVEDIPVYLALADEANFTRKGKIQSFDNQLSMNSGTFRVRAEFANEDGSLTPGLFARVRMGSAEPKDSVLVHDQAVGTDQSKKFVYVIKEDSTAEYREVKLGPMVDGLRIVREGLKGDERVVVNGLMRVQPGAPVMPIPTAMDTLKPLDAPAASTSAPSAH